MKPVKVVIKEKAIPVALVVERRMSPIVLSIQRKARPVVVVVEEFSSYIRTAFLNKIHIRTGMSARSALAGAVSGKIGLRVKIGAYTASDAVLTQKTLLSPHVRSNACFDGSMDIKSAFGVSFHPVSRAPYRVSAYVGVTMKQAVEELGRSTVQQFLWEEF